MKSTKTAVWKSLIALLLCMAMLTGTTFAWFTDAETASGNIIKTGTLGIEMYWTDDPDSGNWYNVEDPNHNTIFSYDNWEPGYTDVKYIKLVNTGELALNYKLTLTPQGGVGKLAEVINVFFANEAVDVQKRDDLKNLRAIGLLNNVLDGGATADGTLLAPGQQSPLHPNGNEIVMTLAMNMITTAGNDYQNESSGNFTVTALATQASFEKDSFGADYDSGAEYPVLLNGSTASVAVTAVNGKVPAGGVAMTGEGISAFVPEGVALATGADKLTLNVTPLANSTSNIATVNDEVLIPVDVHIDGVAEDNTVPIIIDLGEVLPKYLNMGNYHLFHVEDGVNNEMTLVDSEAQLTQHNQYTYDPLTGEVTVAMASFSEVAILTDTTAKWEGKEDYTWYNATDKVLYIANADQLHAFSKIVGGMAVDVTVDNEKRTFAADSFSGKTVTLLSDINLNNGTVLDNAEDTTKTIFYPIGYNNNVGFTSGNNVNRPTESKTGVTSEVYSFEGTFDGNGHTIANFYQNTWEMFGDYNNGYSGTPNYYKDAMGLFAWVDGTVKNLTVDNFKSDGEFTPTGVIAAYAGFDGNATFENIAITNCNPRVYNTGNGGIVGIGGNEAKENEIAFKNITIDNTNTITALWGSWDVACGGLMGMFRGKDSQTAVVTMNNCHVAAQMDVYNDVCGNYQYYWYRYSGMMIGTNKNMTTENGYTVPNTKQYKAENCTVHFGNWNDYYYCELVANSLASYTHDHQFSRLEQIQNVSEIKDENGNWATTGNFILMEGKVPTKTCYHIMKDAEGNLYEHKHDVKDDTNKEIFETKDIDGDGVVDSDVLKENNQRIYLPFDQLFTGYGWGVKHVPIYDDGTPNPFVGVTILDREVADSVEKFETKFTGNFLYRVGNQNPVSIDSLFAAKAKDEADNPITINGSGVWVTVEKIDESMDVGGSFTKSATGNWEDGKIQFNGTGVVKVTIQDYNYCTPTSIYLEVVGAKNHESESISSLSGNTVLLGNTKLNNNGALALQNASLYGNGYEIDVSAGKTTGESISANYLLYLNNGTLDNVQLKGAVYTNFDLIAKNSWNNPVVLSVGNSKIVNSCISNCASPVRLRSGNLEIINSTLKGGFFANLDIRGGNVVLDNVTTINQVNLNDQASNGKTYAGLGIVFFYEGPSSDTTCEIKNNLTQYNFISEAQTDNSYANMLTDEVFGNSKYSSLWYTDADGKKWANTGILSLSGEVDKDNIITTSQTNKDEYTEMSVSYTIPGELVASNGYLYTAKPETPVESYTFASSAQYEIVPKVSFDHSVNEYIKQEGSETSCTSDPLTGKETITFADGDSFTWNVNILKSSNKDISYTVWMDEKEYEDSIVFDESGEYTVVFKYSDANNYRKNANGEIEKYTVEYETSMDIIVSEMKDTAKNAEITFPLLDSYGTTKVTVDGKTYIMPNLTGTDIPKYGDDLDFDADNRKYGSLKADGKTSVDIYYPIIKTAMSGNYMVFPVFGNKNGTLVQITDYADGGTGVATTYDASTQQLPAGLSVSRGYTVQWSTDKDVVGSGSMNYGSWTNGTLAFKYQSSSDTIACKVMSNYLSYYPDINLRSNDRNEQVMVAEYKYVDNKGDTYYYCVGYHIEERNSGYAFGETVPESSGGTCVTPDTLVTLADGTQKRIDQVTYADQLLVWDFQKGEYAAAPAALIVNHGYDNWTVVELTFDDGTVVKAVTAHAFFDADTNEFALLDATNATDYIGHSFVKAGANSYTTVKLVDCKVYVDYVESYTLVSAGHYNFITENILSTTNSLYALQAGLTVGDALKYDEATLKEDIEKYGLYSYEDFAEYVTYEQFLAFNGPYLKISVEKGFCTFEDILNLIDEYLN